MQVQPHYPKPKRWFAYLGLALMIAGAALAFMIRTGDGIEVRDIRFEGTDGVTMSALLYVPEGASEEMPVPGILTVHGYINSREMQDGFAIEFARRGYAVLSIDQTGHGYSGGVVGQNGFGGPDGLAYLRALPFVDADNIGMEGHSMGGWTILAAAAAMPKGRSRGVAGITMDKAARRREKEELERQLEAGRALGAFGRALGATALGRAAPSPPRAARDAGRARAGWRGQEAWRQRGTLSTSPGGASRRPRRTSAGSRSRPATASASCGCWTRT